MPAAIADACSISSSASARTPRCIPALIAFAFALRFSYLIASQALRARWTWRSPSSSSTCWSASASCALPATSSASTSSSRRRPDRARRAARPGRSGRGPSRQALRATAFDRPLALADLLQRADHGTHLIVQERAGVGAHDDLAAFAADGETVEGLHRRLRLALGRAEGGEVVLADERLGGGMHRLGVEGRRHPPDAAGVQRRAGAAVGDAGRGSGASRRRSARRNRRATASAERIATGSRLQVRVDGVADRVARSSRPARSMWATCPSAWTPASVRPAPLTTTRSPEKAAIASSIACWTEGPFCCRCQPTKGPPSYSMVSLKRAIRVTNSSGARRPRRNSAAGTGALPARCTSVSRTASAPQAMVNWSSMTVPGAAPASWLQPGDSGSGPGRDHRRAERANAFRSLAEVHLEPGAGVRRKAADVVVDVRRRPRPVDARLGLVDLLRVGGAFGGLRREGEDAAGKRGERAHHQIGAEAGETLRQLAGGGVGADRDALAHGDRAGVEARLHAHDHDAGLGVAGHDGAGDGRGAAPARQQRGVEVEAAVRAARRGSPAAGSAHRRRPRRRRRRGRRSAPPRRASFRLAGVRTAMPKPAATSWTGERRSARPRPAARGGWV